MRQHLGGLQFPGMPARGFLRRPFQNIGNHTEIVFGIRLIDTNHGAGVIFYLSQQGIDDFHIRSMSVYEYDLVETVVDQGADNIIVQVSESFGSDRNGTQPQSRRPHMMRAVADPGFRGIENLGFLGRPIGDFPGRDHVGEQRTMVGVLFQAGDRHHDDVFFFQILLDVYIG